VLLQPLGREVVSLCTALEITWRVELPEETFQEALENEPLLFGGREVATAVRGVHFRPVLSTPPSSSEPETRAAAAAE
jgi:hypothetical protein